MAKLAFIILLIFNTFNLLACSCSPQMPFKSKDDLKAYDFVALVQISKLAALSNEMWMNLRVNGNIGIHIKELFKGDTTSIVFDDSYSSDCALNLNEKEQWLFLV